MTYPLALHLLTLGWALGGLFALATDTTCTDGLAKNTGVAIWLIASAGFLMAHVLIGISQ